VNTIEEGVELRLAGIEAPILVFNGGIGDETETILKHDLTIAASNLKVVELLSKAAWRYGRDIKVHVKVETGFGRMGIFPEDAVSFLKKLEEVGNIEAEGIYTHFATAHHRDKSYTYEQFGKFGKALDALKKAGMDTLIKHAANSAATLDIPETHLDMVRVGTLLYGQYPSNEVTQKLDLQNTWKLRSTVLSVREFQNSQIVGYGGDFRTKKGTVIATLPIGFADGFSAMPESVALRLRYFFKSLLKKFGFVKREGVEIKGQMAPIAGRISMQHTMVDVTHLFNVMPGDLATISARRTAVSSRIPRIYFKNGTPYKAVTILGERAFKGVEKGEAEADL
jgi:alanine racemase